VLRGLLAKARHPQNKGKDFMSRARVLTVSGLLMLGTTTLVSAQTPVAAADSLNEVVVVATRSPVAVEKVGNAVTVLNEQAIESSQATVVSDLLATTPGVSFSRNGGPGTQTSLRIRGAESDQTLVLIDGVQLNDPASPGGGFDFGNLLVGDISRIEILRGSQSTIYGSQAIGGVVNIITKESDGAISGSVQAESGSLQTGLFKAGVGAKYDKLTLRVAGGYYNTQGVSAFASGAETDPFRNSTYTGRLSYDFTPAVKLDLRAFYADGLYNYDGFPAPAFVFADEGDYGTTRQFVGYAGLNFALFQGRLQNRIAFQKTDTARATFLNTGTAVTKTGWYDGQNKRVEYQGTFRIAEAHQLVLGLQDEDQSMTSGSAPTSAKVGQKSGYLQYQGELLVGLTLTAGTRQDKHDTFGTHNTSQAALAWNLASDTILRASWGQGFKAPTLYQLFSPYFNRGLQPEQSEGWDAGIEQRFMQNTAMVSATYFSRDTTNLISFLSCTTASAAICNQPGHSSGLFGGYYDNTAKARSAGLELQARFNPIEALQIAANYTSMKAENRVAGSTLFGKHLARRPDTTTNLSLTYTWPVRLATTVAARFAGDSFDDAANTRRLDGYTLVDFRASYPLNDKVEVYGRVENLTDKAYQTTYQFGTVGRAVYAGVRAGF